MLVNLKTTNGGNVYVNPEHVVFVLKGAGRDVIVRTTSAEFVVAGPIEDVAVSLDTSVLAGDYSAPGV